MKTVILRLVIIIIGYNLTAQNATGWLLNTTNYDNYYGVTMANGKFGVVTNHFPLSTKEIILGGVYEASEENGISRVLKGIEFLNLNVNYNGNTITENDMTNWNQQVNLRDGLTTTSFEFNKQLKITHTLVVNRALPLAAMAIVEVEALTDGVLNVGNKMAVPSQLKHSESIYRVLKDNQYLMPVFRTSAQSLHDKHTISAATTFLFDDYNPELKGDNNTMHFEVQLKKNQKFRFALAGGIVTSQDVSDPINESERQPIYALQEGIDKVLSQHKQAWHELWDNGDIIIEGDLEAQQTIRFALFNLYASIREHSRQSIPPMGLTAQGYNGHIFWDTELWMYPPLLALQPQLAEACLDYRMDRLPKAKQKAHFNGYKGAMYPWETDDTGEEATPTWALTGIFEQHITSDVAIAFWNYYTVFQDKSWLAEHFDVLESTAEFWLSRVHKNQDGSYSIHNVVGADEYAQHVNDNAFTNGSVIETLKNTIKAARILNKPVNPKWEEVANKLKLHLKNGITQNYEGYNGEMIKQADVNLLAYPLNVITDKAQIKRDLDYYVEKLDKKDGPAMAHGVLTVLYARLGDIDKAYQAFQNSYKPNARPPFGVFSESANSNNPYFVTGAGAMLQGVIFGFGGVNLTDQGMTYNKGLLPKSWKSLTIVGLGPDNKTITIKN